MDPNSSTTTTSVTKFDVNDKTLYVKLIWNHTANDFFHIQIFDGDVSWTGKFTHESAKYYRDRCEETENHYVSNVKRYLNGSALKEVTYDFVINNENSELGNFVWKKILEDSQGFLVHGSVPVKRETSGDSKDLLLDFLLEENRDLRTAIENMTKRNKDITMDLKKCKNELEKFVDIKNSLEERLYGKFVQLLNSKKRRIEILERNLHTLSDSKNDGDG